MCELLLVFLRFTLKSLQSESVFRALSHRSAIVFAFFLDDAFGLTLSQLCPCVLVLSNGLSCVGPLAPKEAIRVTERCTGHVLWVPSPTVLLVSLLSPWRGDTAELLGGVAVAPFDYKIKSKSVFFCTTFDGPVPSSLTKSYLSVDGLPGLAWKVS